MTNRLNSKANRQACSTGEIHYARRSGKNKNGKIMQKIPKQITTKRPKPQAHMQKNDINNDAFHAALIINAI